MKHGWEIKKLGEVCDIICGQDYKSVKDDNGKYPIYGTGGIMGYASQYRCPANSVIIGRKGSINNPLFVDTEFWNVDTAFGVVPNGDILHPKFFYLFCKDYDFTRHDVSVTIPSLRRADILKINVPVPPIAEQEKIVAELDCLSGIIEKKKQQLKELDNLAQSIFYEMFGDPVENDKGWEVKKLGEVCDVRDGTHDSPKYLEHSEYVLVTSKNITSDGDIDFTTANYISKEDYDAINKRSYVDFGDIIMAMIGTIGKPIIVKETSRKFCIKNVALIKFEEFTSVTNTYIQALLSNNSYASYIQGNNKGGTQKFIALGTIRKLLTPIPPLTIQQDFASKIESIEKQKELIAQSIKETETLFNSRMDYYFN